MNVYSKVDRAIAKQLGAKFITTKWVDTSKGCEENAGYSARLVGREVETDQGFDLFAATAPFESLRVILSVRVSHQHEDGPYMSVSSDVNIAYFFAKAKCQYSLKFPLEIVNQEMRTRLAGSTYVSMEQATVQWICKMNLSTFLSAMGF